MGVSSAFGVERVPARPWATMEVPTQPTPERADMKQELIGPTATLAAALLSNLEDEHSEFTPAIVANAFEEAYFMLLEGIQRVDSEIARREKL